MSRSTQTPMMVPVTTSKVIKKPSKAEMPKVAEPRATSTMVKPQSTGAVPKTKSAQPEAKSKKPKEFTLPAYSTMAPKEKQGVATELEKLKKKNVRRIISEGEDIKMIKEVLRAIRDQDIYVQEFVIKIGPHTGDNGDCLRQVMGDELAAFRKLAVKIYETMTQDVGDVLTNEHAELMEYYREKADFFNNRTAQCIYDLYEICPNFNFDHYYSENREQYLQSLFPLPEDEDVDPEELEMQKRQQMYHRLQWLHSEGDRLNAENKMLQKRLAELKRKQKEGLREVGAAMQQAEDRKKELEQQEVQMGQQLDVLNESLEKSIVQQERQRTKVQGAKAKTGAVKKKASKKESTIDRPEWNVNAAAEIEATLLHEYVQAEMGRGVASTSQMSAKKRASKSKFKRPAAKSSDDGGFHFSPIKTPPQPGGSKKPPSPFHYSPPRTPPEEVPIETTTVETTTVVTEEPTTTARLPPRLGRRLVMAPRDTWSGFQ